MSNSETSIDEYLESSLDSVDSSEERAKRLAITAGILEDDAYQLGYAVREAMVNAIVHGNRYSSNKKVHFVVRTVAGAIEVVIEDEGAGFESDSQDDPLAEENLLNQSGRGIMIIRAFVDEFALEKTEQGGTRVLMKKLLPTGT